MEERPDSDLSKVFLRERAPFTSVKRSICRRTMKRAFPDRDVPGSCFHVLRKTPATELLRAGTPSQAVTDFLGHTNEATVQHLHRSSTSLRIPDRKALPSVPALHNIAGRYDKTANHICSDCFQRNLR